MRDGWCTAAIHVFTRPDGWHAGIWLSPTTLQAGYFKDAFETRSVLDQITMYTMALFFWDKFGPIFQCNPAIANNRRNRSPITDP